MSGGKGGSTTSKVEIPDWLESAAQDTLSRADDVSRIGYVPYSGPDVAAFSPMQNAAFDNTNQMASAFGMGGGQGSYMPEAQTFAGGAQGYSSMPLYNEAKGNISDNQHGALMQHLVKPNGNRFKRNGTLRDGGAS